MTVSAELFQDEFLTCDSHYCGNAAVEGENKNREETVGTEGTPLKQTGASFFVENSKHGEELVFDDQLPSHIPTVIKPSYSGLFAGSCGLDSASSGATLPQQRISPKSAQQHTKEITLLQDYYENVIEKLRESQGSLETPSKHNSVSTGAAFVGYSDFPSTFGYNHKNKNCVADTPSSLSFVKLLAPDTGCVKSIITPLSRNYTDNDQSNILAEMEEKILKKEEEFRVAQVRIKKLEYELSSQRESFREQSGVGILDGQFVVSSSGQQQRLQSHHDNASFAVEVELNNVQEQECSAVEMECSKEEIEALRMEHEKSKEEMLEIIHNLENENASLLMENERISRLYEQTEASLHGSHENVAGPPRSLFDELATNGECFGDLNGSGGINLALSSSFQVDMPAGRDEPSSSAIIAPVRNNNAGSYESSLQFNNVVNEEMEMASAGEGGDILHENGEEDRHEQELVRSISDIFPRLMEPHDPTADLAEILSNYKKEMQKPLAACIEQLNKNFADKKARKKQYQLLLAKYRDTEAKLLDAEQRLRLANQLCTGFIKKLEDLENIQDLQGLLTDFKNENEAHEQSMLEREEVGVDAVPLVETSNMEIQTIGGNDADVSDMLRLLAKSSAKKSPRKLLFRKSPKKPIVMPTSHDKISTPPVQVGTAPVVAQKSVSSFLLFSIYSIFVALACVVIGMVLASNVHSNDQMYNLYGETSGLQLQDLINIPSGDAPFKTLFV